MNRPKAIIEANDELEQYEMYSEEPLCDHDGDGARQHIATIYDHEEAHEILRLWNSLENSKSPSLSLKNHKHYENEPTLPPEGLAPTNGSAFERVCNMDPVARQMIRRGASMEDVVVYLAGEKAKLQECLMALHAIADGRNLNLRYDALVVEALVATAANALKKIGQIGLGAAGAQLQARDRDTGIRQISISQEVWRESSHSRCSRCGADGFRTWELGVKLPNEGNIRWDFPHTPVCDGCKDMISQNNKGDSQSPGK